MGTKYAVSDTGLITTVDGLHLPTPGGLAAVLNFYEANTTQSNQFIGPWGGSTFGSYLRFERIGNNVTMSWPGFIGEATSISAVMQSVSPIPAQFSSTSVDFINSVFPTIIYSGNSNTDKVSGQLALLNAGSDTYVVFSNVDGSPISTNFAGIPRGAVTWTII